MNSEARAMYWEFALRLVSRKEVAAWADKALDAGHSNGELFELSTCAELDDNTIMSSLTTLSLGYDRGKVELELIAKLVAYFSHIDAGATVNMSLVSDYRRINDLRDEVVNELQWLDVQIHLSRDGVLESHLHEAQTIVERMSAFITG